MKVYVAAVVVAYFAGHCGGAQADYPGGENGGTPADSTVTGINSSTNSVGGDAPVGTASATNPAGTSPITYNTTTFSEATTGELANKLNSLTYSDLYEFVNHQFGPFQINFTAAQLNLRGVIEGQLEETNDFRYSWKYSYIKV